MPFKPSLTFPISGRSLLLRGRQSSSVMDLCSGIAALILLERYSPAKRQHVIFLPLFLD